MDTMSSQPSCTTSEECEIVIAAGKTIQRHCFERIINSNDTFICDCNPIIGLIGEFCDEFSAQTWIALLFLLIRLISAALCVLFSFYLLKLAITILKTMPKHREPVSNDIIVIIFGSIAVILEMIVATFDILLIFDPSRGKLYTISPGNSDESDIVVSNLGDAFAFFSIGSVFFAFLSAAVIVISWLNVLKTIFEKLDATNIIKLNIAKRVTYSFVSLFFILMLILLFLSAADALMIIIGLLSFFALSLMLFGRQRFLACLKLIPDTNHKLMIVKRIRNFSRNIILLMSILITLNIINTIYQDLYVSYKPGNINFISIVAHSVFLVKNAVVLFNFLFIYDLLKNIIGNQ